VEQVVPRIDRLNGTTVSVEGYLAQCTGYDCVLYRSEANADEAAIATAALREMRDQQPLDLPILGIGSGVDRDFDTKAAPFTGSYVVIVGTVTNMCRYRGKPACTDRTTDFQPISIRAAR